MQYIAKLIKEHSTELAPSEWRNIPEVQAIKPKFDGKKYHEMNLFKISNCPLNICVWMCKSSAYWYEMSDFIIIYEEEINGE
jgi:hypothetical protein